MDWSKVSPPANAPKTWLAQEIAPPQQAQWSSQLGDLPASLARTPQAPAPSQTWPTAPAAWPAPAAPTAWPIASDVPMSPAPIAVSSTISDETQKILTGFGGDIDAVLLEWRKAQETLEIVKSRELKLRLAVFEIKVPSPVNGVNNVPLGEGWLLKATAKLNYTLDKDQTKIEAVLSEIEACGNEGKFLAERLISWNPSLAVSEYNKLDTESANHRKIKQLIDSVLTSKPGTPSLELKSPKDKEK